MIHDYTHLHALAILNLYTAITICSTLFSLWFHRRQRLTGKPLPSSLAARAFVYGTIFYLMSYFLNSVYLIGILMGKM